MAHAARHANKFTIEGVGPRREFVVVDEALALGLLVILERAARKDPPQVIETTVVTLALRGDARDRAGGFVSFDEPHSSIANARARITDLEDAGFTVTWANIVNRAGDELASYSTARGWDAGPAAQP